MVDLPKQYKACVYDSPGSVSTKVEMLDMPEPGNEEVLINLYATAPWETPQSNAAEAPNPRTGLTPASAIPTTVS
jgi:hypothetical protein